MIKAGTKAYRALQALNEGPPTSSPTSGGWMTEQQVWSKAKATDGGAQNFHPTLSELVGHKYAERRGRRGGYEWRITRAGEHFLGVA